MNLLGAPNWISGVSLCAGNTAAINRLTYGWFPMGDFQNTNCIVLFGQGQFAVDCSMMRVIVVSVGLRIVLAINGCVSL